jgi:hypothetical protein
LTILLPSVLACALAASAALNFHFYRKLANPKRPESYELQQFLHDLTAGSGLVRVIRVSPVDVMIRSPRDL